MPGLLLTGMAPIIVRALALMIESRLADGSIIQSCRLGGLNSSVAGCWFIVMVLTVLLLDTWTMWIALVRRLSMNNWLFSGLTVIVRGRLLSVNAVIMLFFLVLSWSTSLLLVPVMQVFRVVMLDVVRSKAFVRVSVVEATSVCTCAVLMVGYMVVDAVV